jgi:hypothetical protein
MYASTIGAWARRSSLPIVFAENSDTEGVERLKLAAAVPAARQAAVELLSTPPTPHLGIWGVGGDVGLVCAQHVGTSERPLRPRRHVQGHRALLCTTSRTLCETPAPLASNGPSRTRRGRESGTASPAARPSGRAAPALCWRRRSWPCRRVSGATFSTRTQLTEWRLLAALHRVLPQQTRAHTRRSSRLHAAVLADSAR